MRRLLRGAPVPLRGSDQGGLARHLDGGPRGFLPPLSDGAGRASAEVGFEACRGCREHAHPLPFELDHQAPCEQRRHCEESRAGTRVEHRGLSSHALNLVLSAEFPRPRMGCNDAEQASASRRLRKRFTPPTGLFWYLAAHWCLRLPAVPPPLSTAARIGVVSARSMTTATLPGRDAGLRHLALFSSPGASFARESEGVARVALSVPESESR